MTIASAVRKLVGVERAETQAPFAVPAIDREALQRPVTAARERLDTAKHEHERTLARVDAVDSDLRLAQQAFDANPTDEGADRIVELRREREWRDLFAQRTQRAIAEAEGELRGAEQARDTEILRHLDTRAAADVRVRALWEEGGEQALATFVAFLRELEATMQDAQVAVVEAGNIRGNSEQASFRVRGIQALRSVVSGWVTSSIGDNERRLAEAMFR